MIRFTYITVTWQAEAVVGRTLDSVLSQDYPCVEHLIIDGASTDGTLALVNDYAERSKDVAPEHVVAVMSEKDNGIYDAMNKGLRSATGDYVCFLNAGDALPTPNTVSLIAEQLNAYPAPLPAVLYGNTDVVDSEGHFLYHRRLQPPEHLTWRSFQQGMLVCHQAFYARTDFAVANPFNLDYRYSADVDWCIRVMRQADQERVPMLNLHTVVAHYLNEGTTTRHHRDSLRERFSVMRSHYGLLTTVAMHAWFVVRAVFKR